MYRVAVRAKYPRAVLEERPIEAYVDFKTQPKGELSTRLRAVDIALAVGLPDPPACVQCEPGPQDGTLLISWQPVTTQPKPPSRAAVAGYLVYADGKKVLCVVARVGGTCNAQVSEVNSASGDHVLLRLSEFVDDPPLFITVRTRTKEGAVSADSNVVRVPRTLVSTMRQTGQLMRSSTAHAGLAQAPPPSHPPPAHLVSSSSCTHGTIATS